MCVHKRMDGEIMNLKKLYEFLSSIKEIKQSMKV